MKPYSSPQRRQSHGSHGRSHENSAGASESDNDIEDMRRERPTTRYVLGTNTGNRVYEIKISLHRCFAAHVKHLIEG